MALSSPVLGVLYYCLVSISNHLFQQGEFFIVVLAFALDHLFVNHWAPLKATVDCEISAWSSFHRYTPFNAQAWLGLGRAPVTQTHKHTDLDVSDWGWGGSMVIEKFGTHRDSFFLDETTCLVVDGGVRCNTIWMKI